MVELNGLNCCHLAIILAIISCVETALFLGYTFKINNQQIQLEANENNYQLRIRELEKKDGSELKRIEQLEAKLEKLSKK